MPSAGAADCRSNPRQGHGGGCHVTLTPGTRHISVPGPLRPSASASLPPTVLGLGLAVGTSQAPGAGGGARHCLVSRERVRWEPGEDEEGDDWAPAGPQSKAAANIVLEIE